MQIFINTEQLDRFNALFPSLDQMISQASGSVHCHQKILSCAGKTDVKALDIVTQIFTIPFLCRIHNGD